jgi:hypothetical protein
MMGRYLLQEEGFLVLVMGFGFSSDVKGIHKGGRL